MIFFVILLKACAWVAVFRSAMKADLPGMVLRAAAITLLLTAADKVSVASNLHLTAILLTLVLYALMSFILISLAWKLRIGWVTLTCSVIGTLGALAGVNFTMDLLRGLFPFLNQS